MENLYAISKKMERVVSNFASKNNINYWDLFDYANWTLLKCIQKFNTEKSKNFEAYFFSVLKKNMVFFCIKKKKEEPIENLSDYLYYIDNYESEIEFKDILEKLSAPTQELLNVLFAPSDFDQIFLVEKKKITKEKITKYLRNNKKWNRSQISQSFREIRNII